MACLCFGVSLCLFLGSGLEDTGNLASAYIFGAGRVTQGLGVVVHTYGVVRCKLGTCVTEAPR